MSCAKDETERVAVAAGSVLMEPATLDLILAGGVAKGDVLAVARLAGIMAAKRTPDLIPLCHPLALSAVDGRAGLRPRAQRRRHHGDLPHHGPHRRRNGSADRGFASRR